VIGSIVLIVLFASIVATLPGWSYSRPWGYAVSGFLSLLFVIALVIVIRGTG
jgi:hypothetical protein